VSSPATVMHQGRAFAKQANGLYIPKFSVIVPQPPSGKAFEVHGGIVIPAIGATGTVLSFTVPRGNNGFIRRIANVFVGGGFTDFSGAIVWQILIDQTKGIVAPGFDNMIASLGSVVSPSVIDGIHIEEGTLVALTVKNVSVVVSGQLIGGRLGGSFHSIPQEPPNLAF
jgi:hypothetical protein